jgi:hypothetical protein
LGFYDQTLSLNFVGQMFTLCCLCPQRSQRTKTVYGAKFPTLTGVGV